MDYKQIQELIKTVNKSNIGELSIEEKDFKITIKQKKELIQTFVNPPQQPYVAQPLPHAPVGILPNNTAPQLPSSPASPTSSDIITIKSPMIGTFYRRPSPDKPLLTEVGSEVKVGQTVCIIEAMKLFNEIESEISGTIVKILVDDASPVEYDQPLFLVDPA